MNFTPWFYSLPLKRTSLLCTKHTLLLILALLHSLPCPSLCPQEEHPLFWMTCSLQAWDWVFWLVGTLKTFFWTLTNFPNYISSLRASCNRRRASMTLCSWRWMSSSETSICWMWGWLASMLTPGFFWMDDRLLLCPVTGTVFRWRAAEMLCSTLSVASSGPTPVQRKNRCEKQGGWVDGYDQEAGLETER